MKKLLLKGFIGKNFKLTLDLSLAGFFIFYTVLLVIELFLMTKYVRLGPSSLHTGRYHFEQEEGLSHV